jgi:hypothetical protein
MSASILVSLMWVVLTVAGVFAALLGLDRLEDLIPRSRPSSPRAPRRHRPLDGPMDDITRLTL